MSKRSTDSESLTTSSSSTSLPYSSPLSHPSLVPSLKPRLYRSCSSPRLPVILETPGPGRTLQSFKDECDINRIMKRYQTTGVIDHVNRHPPQFGDIGVYDFQESLNIVIEAENRFAALPSDVRDRFGNDPGRLLDFVSKAENLQEAAKLGLIDLPPAPVGGPPAPPEKPATGSTAAPGASPAPTSASSPSSGA